MGKVIEKLKLWWKVRRIKREWRRVLKAADADTWHTPVWKAEAGAKTESDPGEII